MSAFAENRTYRPRAMRSLMIASVSYISVRDCRRKPPLRLRVAHGEEPGEPGGDADRGWQPSHHQKSTPVGLRAEPG
jgi:hypothetical protein